MPDFAGWIARLCCGLLAQMLDVCGYPSGSTRSWTPSPQGTGGVNNDIALGPDNLFIHMTGMSDLAWQGVKNAGAQVSISFPIEMNMRHGIPPILKMQSLGIEPSLSSDVEVTMTADFVGEIQ